MIRFFKIDFLIENCLLIFEKEEPEFTVNFDPLGIDKFKVE
jgi:hypothetical protein